MTYIELKKINPLYLVMRKLYFKTLADKNIRVQTTIKTFGLFFREKVTGYRTLLLKSVLYKKCFSS